MAAVAAYRPVSDTFSRLSGGGRNEFIISSLDNLCTKPSGPSRGLSCPSGPRSLLVILNTLPVILSAANNLAPSVILKPAVSLPKGEAKNLPNQIIILNT